MYLYTLKIGKAKQFLSDAILSRSCLIYGQGTETSGGRLIKREGQGQGGEETSLMDGREGI